MGIEQFPPVRTIMGLVHDRHSLPARAEAGEAYYDASSGHLWVWDAAHGRWHDLHLWQKFGSAAGAAAVAGAIGPRGEAGPAGSKGERGEPGPAGSKGERGEAGPAGPKGERGEAGPAGPKGEPGGHGKDGIAGRDGHEGKPGIAGARGLDGAPAKQSLLPWLAAPLLGLAGGWFGGGMNPKEVETKTVVEKIIEKPMVTREVVIKEPAPVVKEPAPVVKEERRREPVVSTVESRTAVVDRQETVVTDTQKPAVMEEKAVVTGESEEVVRFREVATGWFGRLSETLAGVTDATTARAALPTLNDLGDTLKTAQTTTASFSPEQKAAVRTMVGENLPAVRSTADTVLGLDGVGDVLGTIVRPMIETVSRLGQ